MANETSSEVSPMSTIVPASSLPSNSSSSTTSSSSSSNSGTAPQSSSSAGDDGPDCTNPIKPCACTADQICVQIGRSGTQCARNTCIDRADAPGGVGGGGGGNNGSNRSSVGAVAGEAVGGVVAGLVIAVALYWFWWRRRPAFLNGKNRPRRTHPNNPLQTFRIGRGNKEHNNGSGGGGGAPEKDITDAPSPDEQDAAPIKRQSLRFDPNNLNGGTISRRSLSGSALTLPPTVGRSDNPFGDHHSIIGTDGHSIAPSPTNANSNTTHANFRGGIGHVRDDSNASGPCISEFSFRSSAHSSSQATNIIPIAYIPAHSASPSIADLTDHRAAYGQQTQLQPHSSNRGLRQSAFSNPTTRPSSSSQADIIHSDNNQRERLRHSFGAFSSYTRDSSALDSAGQMRSSHLSVPFSLRSSTAGETVFGNGAAHHSGNTFSALFDRRSSRPPGILRNPSREAASPGSMGSNAGGGGGLEVLTSPMVNGPVSPPLTTPTFTKNGRPIRPPRAPGLDLKLPDPEPVSPPALPSPGYPWATSPTGTTNTSLHPPSLPHGTSGRRSQRETLRSPADGVTDTRNSAYSTFSQTTGSTASHMNYILDPPQIITPVSAGGLQVINRAAAKTVKLPTSAVNTPHPAQMVAFPPSPLPGSSSISPGGSSYVRTPLARIPSFNNSHSSDNPFDDEAAVRIAMPSSTGSTPVLNQAATFTNPSSQQQQQQQEEEEGALHKAASTNTFGIQDRQASHRDSDLSIFTSSSAHHTGTSGSHHEEGIRTSFTSAIYQPSSASASSDEVILSPPVRPFAGEKSALPGSNPADSRHNSAAMSTRSGYASVLDGIPFNLSLSPEPRLSSSSSIGAGPPRGSGGRDMDNLRQSSASALSAADSNLDSDGKRDTSYSLASEWNGAFASIPIVIGGIPENSQEEPVPSLPSIYLAGTASQRAEITIVTNNGRDTISSVGTRQEGDDQDDEVALKGKEERYSSDSLAMAAAVARSFHNRN